jgi:nucleoside-diphosphate-sugar epimerase
MFDKVREILRPKTAGKMHNVAILGGNSLLGQHILSRLLDSTVHHISIWTFKESFVNRLEVNHNNPTHGVSYFVGLDNLKAAVTNCDTVFNMHEAQDFSNSPDKNLLQQHNVDFVQKLLSDCAETGVANLVHASSIYLQCSAWWPNVGSREQDSKRFIRDNPFPAYFNSKFEAERLISECDYMKSVVARLGMLYGEGDRCSVICDAIKMSETIDPLPIIGDLGGAVQFTYAGNAAAALIKCAEKIARFPSLQQEVINISDSTSVQPLFDGIARDCFEAGGNSLSSLHIPFWLFFPVYFLLSMLGYLIDFIPVVKNPIGNMPSASYIYFLLRQWTFVSDYRLRLLIDFVPPFDEDESLHRSLKYYGKQLHRQDIKSYSWRTTGEV